MYAILPTEASDQKEVYCKLDIMHIIWHLIWFDLNLFHKISKHLKPKVGTDIHSSQTMNPDQCSDALISLSDQLPWDWV